MVRTASTMMPLGTAAPAFSLVNVDGRTVSNTDFQGAPGLLVIFMCNHCPYVIHVADHLASLGMEYQSRGLAIAAINANDTAAYPMDSPEQMVHEAENRGYVFPYLFDETQEVAKEYGASCTPDFFLFDGDQKLVYRGQLDDSRPKTEIPVTGTDLRQAIDALLAGKAIIAEQKPAIGCNIKWKDGNEPKYFNPAGIS